MKHVLPAVILMLCLLGNTVLGQKITRTFIPSNFNIQEECVSKIDPALLSLISTPVEELRTTKCSTPFRFTGSGEVEVAVFVKTDDLVQLAATVPFSQHSISGNIVSLRCKASELSTIANLPGTRYIESSAYLYSNMDNSIPSIHADDVWNYTYQDIPVKGNGVLIGIIDTGLDYFQPDFIANDTVAARNAWESRIEAIWDQFVPNDSLGQPPAGYSYGTEYNHDQINQAIRNDAPFLSSDTNGHGTHVAGIACGDGTSTAAGYRGVAPDGRLLICKNQVASLFTYDATTMGTLDAIDWMLAKKNEYEKPLVINFSAGTTMGPHDGTTLFEQAINYRVQNNGLILVVAAGNNRNDSRHAQYDIPENGSLEFSIRFYNELTVVEDRKIQFWYSGSNHFSIQIKPGKLQSAWSDPIPLGSVLAAFSYGNLLYGYATVSNFSSELNNDNVIDVNIMCLGSTPNTISDEWQIRITDNDNVSNSVVNGYLERYVKGRFIQGVSPAGTIGMPASASGVITVASYSTKNTWNSLNGVQSRESVVINDIDAYSSKGPLRNSTSNSKPDIAAPGQYIVSAYSKETQWTEQAYNDGVLNNMLISEPEGSFHLAKNGTSMAAPHVAGAIALLLQHFPLLTPVDCKLILSESASTVDPAQGDQTDWGAGKVNVLEAYKYMVGFSYIQTYLYDETKYKAAYNRLGTPCLPIEPVQSSWGSPGYSKQKFTNGAIYLNNDNDSAFWIGEGIWNKWIELDSTQSVIGLPVSKEFPDPNTLNYPTTYFSNGKIYWNGAEAIPVYFLAGFKADKRNGAAPLTVQFNDTSLITPGWPATSRLWDFGDGSFSVEPNPVHTYEDIGMYNVSLKLFDQGHAYLCSRQHYITSLSSVCPTMLQRAEYFLDTDPGMGNGTPVLFNPGSLVDSSFNISLASVIPGLHTLCFRVLDDSSRWSLPQSAAIFVESAETTTTLPDITRIEYYFDANLPLGTAPALASPHGNDIAASGNLNLSALDPGPHRLFVRAKDSRGQWSVPVSRQVYVNARPAVSPPAITRIEYFLDNPVPDGTATALAFTAGTNVTTFAAIDLSSVNPGLHRLFFRAKDTLGHWSIPQSRTLILQKNCPGDTLPDIIRSEYFFDADPGMGNGQVMSLTPSHDVTIGTYIPLNSLSPGNHSLYFRTRDATGVWGLPQSSTISIDVSPLPPMLNLENMTVSAGQNFCYGATQTITVSGGTGVFDVQNGACLSLIAGQNIIILPVTSVQSGGYFHGAIDANGQYCNSLKSAVSGSMAFTDLRENYFPCSAGSFFKAYPNPTTGTFLVELSDEPDGTPVHVRLFDVMGSEITEKVILTGKVHELSLSGQTPGMYILRVVTDTGSGNAKIIRQ